MKKIIHNKFEKASIPSLPRAVFQGRIFTVLTASEAQRAVNYLLSQSILGVDTETRPSFRRGQQFMVSLLQVSTHDTCFLFRLSNFGMTAAVKRLLEDTSVLKIGLSWHDDLHGLQRLGKFHPGLFVDLQELVSEIGIEDLSLQKIYANIFGQRISKRDRLSNWEADILNEAQKLYAATDAWACIMLYEEIMRLKETGDYELLVTEEENYDKR